MPRILSTLAAPLLAIFATTQLAVIATAQDRFANVEIKTTEIVPGIYMLGGAGGNIGLSIGEDGPFIIDDQFAPLSEKILAAIGALTDADPAFVLNTHWHGDHVGGNEALHNAGAIIVAHDNVRKRLQEGRTGTRPVAPATADTLPVITFSKTMTFHWNGHEIFILHPSAAHTDGDALVYFKDVDVLHMGDVFFNGSYPFIDLNSGGDLDGYIKAHEKVLTKITDATKIIPGHGSMATKADLLANKDMLIEVRAHIQKAIDAGASEDETVAQDPLKELSKKWGKGFINGEFMTRTAYKSLSAE